jgi:hypothetical protein
MHDLGVFGKETSCYFQAVAGQNVVADNICYNGPRAVRASSCFFFFFLLLTPDFLLLTSYFLLLTSYF